ncbi:MAG: 30S ribosomal protein S6 [Myxococcota bacterium]
MTNSPSRWAREYETIYILRPNVEPDDAEKVATRIREVIDRGGGKMTRVDNWGRRRLSYSIQKHTRGVFIYTRYVGFSDLVAELERNLRMLDDVIRHQTVRLRDYTTDPKEIEVDPEEVKFLPIEHVEEEEEDSTVEQLFGTTASARSNEAETEQEKEADAAVVEADAAVVEEEPAKAEDTSGSTGEEGGSGNSAGSSEEKPDADELPATE